MKDQELAEHLASETGKVLLAIHQSKASTLTPEALGAAGDLAAHEFVVHELAKYRPLDHILSEEGEDNVGRLAANRVWIIDPLDGTSHYSKNDGQFAVHVALWERDTAAPFKLSAAAISVPVKEIVIGTNPAKLISAETKLIRILVSATRAPDEIKKVCARLKTEFAQLGEPQLIPMGSVGAKLASIINGEADLYLNTGGFYEWDIAAPAAVAKAHGLTVCDIKGVPLEFNKPDTFVPNAVIGKPQFVAAIIKSLA